MERIILMILRSLHKVPGWWFRLCAYGRDEKFEKHSEEKQFVYINAFNEWAEGTYLEPDTDNGYAYLEAVKQAVEEVNS